VNKVTFSQDEGLGSNQE